MGEYGDFLVMVVARVEGHVHRRVGHGLSEALHAETPLGRLLNRRVRARQLMHLTLGEGKGRVRCGEVSRLKREREEDVETQKAREGDDESE